MLHQESKVGHLVLSVQVGATKSLDLGARRSKPSAT